MKFSIIQARVHQILEKVKLFKHTIVGFITKQTEESGRQIVAFGIILTINYPLYYLIWLYASYQTYENLPLRLSASLCCSLLIFKDYWSKNLKAVLPFYWYATATYCLPFFFTFMTLKNNGSTMWLMNCVSVIFFLLLLFDVISAIIILAVGISSGLLVYSITTSTPFILDPGTINLPGIIAAFGAAFIIGGIFAHNKEKIQKEKLATMKTLAMDIAHELRTPLATINAAALGTKQYLPDLISAYQSAKNADLPIKHIRPSQIELMYSAMDDISNETHSSNNFINMLLTNVGQQNINTSEFRICSIVDCVDKALNRYPFHADERALITWRGEKDFSFLGDELLTLHVLFNLLKNSIYYIKSAHKGNISIWLELKDKYNQLHFRDTGKGIPSILLPQIFELFFSKTYHGSGIGLAFCKTVMQSYGGEIECISTEGEFTEFILSFPKTKQL